MNESEETEEIKAFPSTFTWCKDSRPFSAISQYQLHDTFASPHHPHPPPATCIFRVWNTYQKIHVFLFCFFFGQRKSPYPTMSK